MHALAPLVVVTALALSGCATAAQGASGRPDVSAPAPSPTQAPASPPTQTPVATRSANADAAPPLTSASPGLGAAFPSAAAEDPTIPASPVPLQPSVTTPTSSAPLPPNPYDLGGPAPAGSYVLGDSISLSVGPVLARLGYPVMGIVGQSVSENYLRTNLSSALAQAAPAWVIELGTNNTADPADVARIAGWVDLVNTLRSPTRRQQVYWVTPHRPPSYNGSKSAWTMDAFNAELRRIDADTKWLHVIDFDAVAKGHPEWFDQDTALHVHPNRDGQGVLVALIAGADAVPVEIPAPVLSAAATGVAAETFDNATIPPTLPGAAAGAAVTASSSGAPSAVASSDVAGSVRPVVTTTDEASAAPTG